MSGGSAKRVILAGGGHAHLAVLHHWAAEPSRGEERLLITPHAFALYSGMVPGWMAGIYPAEALRIDLGELAVRAEAKLVAAEVTGLDTAQRHVTLSNGEVLDFDLLSLATGGGINLAPFAASTAAILPVRPVEGLIAGWEQFLNAAPSAPAVAVVGGGAAGVELALAAQARLADVATVTLVCPPGEFLSGHHPRVRRLARAALDRSGIALRYGLAAGAPGGLALDDGAPLPADLVMVATGSRPPSWLAASGLASSAGGFALVGADLRSVSHPAVFAAGDIVDRADRPLPRSGVHAVKAGPVLAANLASALHGGAMQGYQPGPRTLYLLSTANRRAIASWGGLALAGRAVWWLKDHIDRGFVRRQGRLG
jgi:pyridine nucleotide-disulfide oxidoreductase family protein